MNLCDIFDHDKLYLTFLNSGKHSQLTWLRLNHYDNKLEHFWTTLLQPLVEWDEESFASMREKRLPRSLVERQQFFAAQIEHIRQKAAQNPLIVLVENLSVIRDQNVIKFFEQFIQIEGIFAAEVAVKSLYDTVIKDHLPVRPHNTLYLTLKEEEEYYHARNLALTTEQAEMIRSYTDGWPASVVMVADMMLLAGGKLLQEMDVHLYNWIEEVFLDRYTSVDFQRLIKLSLLGEFPVGLLQHLSDWDRDSTMKMLTRNSLIRYNQETNCYYFASYAQTYFHKKAGQLGEKQRRAFYKKAAVWFEKAGQDIEAVKYYVKAKEYRSVIPIICRMQFPPSRELANLYIKAITEIPDPLREEYPTLQLVHGAALCTLYHYQDAYELLERFCRTCDRGDLEMADQMRTILGEAYLICGHASTCLPIDEAVTFRLYRRSHELIPDGSKMFPPMVNLFSDSPVLQLKSPAPGALRRNLNFIPQFEDYVSAQGAYKGASFLALAEYYYLLHNFREIEVNARLSIQTALANRQYDLACSACFLLMRLFIAKGNYGKAMEALKLLQQYAKEFDGSDFFSMPDLAKSWLYLKVEKTYKVAPWIRDESQYERVVKPWNYGRNRVVKAMYLLETEDYNTLVAYAGSTIELFKKRGYHLLNLYLKTMLAIGYQALAEPDKAAIAFEDLYHWCAGSGIVMPVIEFGKYISPVVNLYQASDYKNIPEEWLTDIRKKANSYYVYLNHIRKQYEQRTARPYSPLERLTTAERKLLLLVSQGLATKEIAEMQGKTLHAVKSMLVRTYDKIGASNKTDAIRIAAEHRIEQLVNL